MVKGYRKPRLKFWTGGQISPFQISNLAVLSYDFDSYSNTFNAILQSAKAP